MRRKIHKLKLTHISAVDYPCQEGALAVILKRRDDEDLDKLDRTEDQGHQHSNIHTAGAAHSPASASRLLAREDDPRDQDKVLPSPFDDAVKMIAKRDSLPMHRAMEKARIEFPAEFEKFQNEGRVSSRPSPILKTASDSVQKFETIVNQIADIRKVSGTDALEIARREHPTEYEAFQAA